MTCTKKGPAPQKAWSMAIATAFLTTMMLVGAKDLAAQRPASVTPPESVLKGAADFLGSWEVSDVDRFDQETACLELKDALGAPLKRCSLPFNELKSYLHPRALAWLQFADERLVHKWYCIPHTVPVILDMGTWTFMQISAGEWEVENLQWSGPVKRQVWMDGRGHPAPIEIFYQGHTIGWFENGELVLETTNFTFDPTGMEDHSRIPSSHLKKVTERYRKTGPEMLSLTITHEDRLFLKRPYTWTIELVKTTRPEAIAYTCDAANAEEELQQIAPDPYRGQ
jgi:hypothetical protein